MASPRKRRKLDALARKARRFGPPRVKDGDRRRRTTTDLVRDALERKRLAREWTIDDPPPPIEIG